MERYTLNLWSILRAFLRVTVGLLSRCPWSCLLSNGTKLATSRVPKLCCTSTTVLSLRATRRISRTHFISGNGWRMSRACALMLAKPSRSRARGMRTNHSNSRVGRLFGWGLCLGSLSACSRGLLLSMKLNVRMVWLPLLVASVCSLSRVNFVLCLLPSSWPVKRPGAGFSTASLPVMSCWIGRTKSLFIILTPTCTRPLISVNSFCGVIGLICSSLLLKTFWWLWPNGGQNTIMSPGMIIPLWSSLCVPPCSNSSVGLIIRVGSLGPWGRGIRLVPLCGALVWHTIFARIGECCVSRIGSNVLVMMRRWHDSLVSWLPLLSSNLSISSLLSTSRVMSLLSCLVVCVRQLTLRKNLPIARCVTMRFALPPITSINSVPIFSIFVNGPVPLMIWLLGSVGTPMVSNILLSNKWLVLDVSYYHEKKYQPIYFRWGGGGAPLRTSVVLRWSRPRARERLQMRRLQR